MNSKPSPYESRETGAVQPRCLLWRGRRARAGGGGGVGGVRGGEWVEVGEGWVELGAESGRRWGEGVG